MTRIFLHTRKGCLVSLLSCILDASSPDFYTVCAWALLTTCAWNHVAYISDVIKLLFKGHHHTAELRLPGNGYGQDSMQPQRLSDRYTMVLRGLLSSQRGERRKGENATSCHREIYRLITG